MPESTNVLMQTPFLASQDAIEVMLVTYYLIVPTDLTGVTLVSEDAYGDNEEDEEDEGYEEDEDEIQCSCNSQRSEKK